MPHGRFWLPEFSRGRVLFTAVAVDGRVQTRSAAGAVPQRVGSSGTLHRYLTPRDAERGGDGERLAAVDNAVTEPTRGAKSSLALSNLRAIVIVIVVAFHSALAYLGSLTTAAFRFGDPPFKWRAFPVVDSHRWFGFDLFCAWQDVYLMSLMFFLSALFTWPSLARKTSRKFLIDRLLRLGVPFVFAVIVVVPIAEYPAYRVTAANPGVMDYARQYLALPFWPNGPMWFLWQLLALTFLAAGLYRFAPRWVEFLGRASASADVRPGRYFAGLAAAAVLAYVPLALIFTPWTWSATGPLALQFSRPLLYAAIYVAGLGIGAVGLGRGLLSSDGMLARRWSVWLAGAFGSYLLWMSLTALAMRYPEAPLVLQLVVDSSYALACVSGCCFVMAACLRFGAVRSPILASLADSAFGIYLLHYVFVVWLQYTLLGVALFAPAKGAIVFAGSLLLSWAAVAAIRKVPFGPTLIGEARRVSATPRPSLVDSNHDQDRRKLPPTHLVRP